jgi:hypothetical protein
LNEQWQAFAWVVLLGQNRVPHTWLLNMGPGGYENCPSNLQQQSVVTQMNLLHRSMSWPNMTTMMIYRILESCEDHTKQLTEHGDMLLSDESSSEIVRTLYQGMPL